MDYQGIERRHHLALVTRNTEYHMFDDRCVAVRDLETGEWITNHDALGKKLVFGIDFAHEGKWNITPGRAEVGQRITFENDLVTSPLAAVTRPELQVVKSYPQLFSR